MGQQLKIQIEQLVVMVSFLMLMVSFEYFPEEYYHLEQLYWVYSVVVTIDCVPLHVFVLIDTQRRFFFDVAVLSVLF